MSWLDKKFLNAETLQSGKCIIDEQLSRTHGLCIQWEDGTEQLVNMNYVCESRESEIWSQTQYQNVYWYMGKSGDHDYGYQCLADKSFVKDPKYFEELYNKVKRMEEIFA